MDIITLIWLVISGIVIIALLLLVQEVRALRGEARQIRQLICTDLIEIQQLLSKRESRRIEQAAREAHERVAAISEGRADAEQRIDVGRVLDETEADKWLLESERLARARLMADQELQQGRARPKAYVVTAQILRVFLGLGFGAGVGALISHLAR